MDTQQFELIVDSHESAIKAKLESDQLHKECSHVKFTIEQLDVGDFIFKFNGNICCLVERKEVNDWASSITDKRSKNQSIRISQLRKENPDILIIYLIEGQHPHKDHKFRNGITRDSLYSSFVNRVIRDRFTIYHTADTTDTALFIAKLFDKLPEHYSKTGVPDERLEYLKTIKLAKKDNMTPENCYVCQLSQIPGVSIDFANLIASQPEFSSMQKLIMTYHNTNNETTKENLLANIIVPIANDKTRRLGKVISHRVYQYLCPPTATSTPVPETLNLDKIKITLKKS